MIEHALRNAQFALAPALAHALVHSLWQDALLALLAAAAFAWCKRRSAAFRHTLGMAFLLAMVGVPLLTLGLFLDRPAAAAGGGFLPVMTPLAMTAATGVFHRESNSLSAIVSLAWLLGAALMFLRQLGGLRLLGLLERERFAALPPPWQARFDALRRAMGITRAVAVRMADGIASPFTARVIRPVVWLPASLLTQLPPDQVEALLAHELAHIRRLDWLWNGMQCVVESLLFYHPGAWWLSRRIRQEREHACDDLAVAACGDAIVLAEALAALERRRLPSPHLVLTADGGSLMQRITRLLSGAPSRARWRATAGLAVLLVSGTLLAMQLDGSSRPWSGVRINSSTDGALHPGDYRDITANGLGLQRHYRISMDPQGRITETYEENDQAKAIDGKVRAWLSDIAAMAPPPPPPPPAPPPPPTMAELPLPPTPPALTDSVEFKELMRVVAADGRVAARLGVPLEADPVSVSGSINLDGEGNSSGDADFTVVLSGPKGHAKVRFVGERNAGAWRLQTLDIGSVTH